MKDPLPKSMRAPIGGVLETGFRREQNTLTTQTWPRLKLGVLVAWKIGPL